MIERIESPEQYVKTQRKRLTKGEIDLHEYGRMLRLIAPALSYKFLKNNGKTW